MKTCVVRRRFWATEADNATVDVDLEPNFGTIKGCIIFYIENNAATDAFDTTLRFRNVGVGFASTNTYVTNIITLEDAAATGTSTQKAHSNANFISATSTDRNTVHYRCTSATFATDKIRFVFANQSPQTNGHLDALIWAISGEEISVGVGFSSFSTNTGTSRIYSQLNFQPDIIFISSSNTTLNQSVTGDSNFSFGVATRSPLQQSCLGWWYQNSVGTTNQVIRESNTSITNFPANAGSVVTAAIGSIGANGWTMTNTGTFGTNIVYNFFAIAGISPSDFALLNVDTPTGTGSNFSGLGSSGFIPETVIGMTSYVQTRDATQSSSATGADGFGLCAGVATSHTKLYNGNGTITYNAVGSAVTGTGTTFFKFFSGTRLYTTDGSLIGTVSTATGNTALTLTANALLTGTGQSYVYSDFRQGTLSIGDNDNTAGATVYSQISSRLYTVAEGTPSVVVQGSLVTPDTRNGLQISYSTVDVNPTFGWLAAFKNQTTSRRRGGIS